MTIMDCKLCGSEMDCRVHDKYMHEKTYVCYLCGFRVYLYAGTIEYNYDDVDEELAWDDEYIYTQLKYDFDEELVASDYQNGNLKHVSLDRIEEILEEIIHDQDFQ